jgi:hypothetical protein
MTVDELVVELKLDPSNFTKGQRDALDSFKKTDDEMQKRQKNLEAANKNVGYSFEGISHAAEGLFSVLAGAGMAAFARDTMTSVAATGRLAHNIGETSSELSAFGRMIERNGGNADAAMGSLKGFSDQITRLNTLGQGSPELFNFLGTIGGEAGEGPLATFMKFAEWAERHKDNPQLVNLIGTQGGFDQGTINEAMKGRVQVLKDLAEASRGAIDPAQVRTLTDLQKAWIGLDQAIEKTGRDILTDAAPAVTSIMTAATDWIERNQKLADSLGEIATAIVGLGALKPAAWLLRLLGFGGAASVAGPLAVAGGLAYANLPTTANAGEQNIYQNGQLTDYGRKITGQGGAGAFGSQAEKEAFIRASAIKAGINPDIAMAVAHSEGFDKFSGDHGSSGGAFQLHVSPGGRDHAVGDQFKSLTGLDPLNPNNEHESIMFALEWAKRHGWNSDFHGSRGKVGDRQGIGDINVTVETTSTDPHTHGRIVGNEIKNRLSSGIATQANTGLN